ncbi:MAG: hypothetical protein ABEJ36_04215 [Candidatus Nanosalina sp.]
MKGQAGTVLMVAVTLGTMLSGFLAIAQMQTLPSIYGQYVNDAGLITEAETRYELAVNNYLPLSAHYAVAEAAYQVGKNNKTYDPGGEINEGVNNPSTSDEFSDVYDDMVDNVDSKSDNIFVKYLDDYGYGPCEVTMADDTEVDPGFDSSGNLRSEIDVFTLSSDQLVNVTCRTNDKRIFIQGERESFDANMVNNKFPELASLMAKGIVEAENVSEQIDKNQNDAGTVTGKDLACDSSTRADAKADAKDKAEQEAWDKVRQVFVAIVKRDHGIGSGGKRGIKQAMYDKLSAGQICIPFTNICSEPNFFDGFIWSDIEGDTFKTIDNESDVDYKSGSATASKCGCEGTWYCPNMDGDSEDEYTVQIDYSSSYGRSCGFTADHDDGTSSPECTQAGWYYSGGDCDTSDTDTACEDSNEYLDGSSCYNSTSSPKHVTDSSPCDESKFVFSGGSCVEDEPAGGPSCPDEDFTFDSGSNSCVSTYSTPSVKCTDWKYNADATYKWDVDHMTAWVRIRDDERVIPTSSGWVNLFITRKYSRSFENGGSYEGVS